MYVSVRDAGQARHETRPTVRWSPQFMTLLQKTPAGTRIDEDTSDSSGGTSAGIPGSSSGTTGSSSIIRSSSGGSGSDTEDAMGTHVSSGVKAARKAAKQLPLSKTLTLEYRASKRMQHVQTKARLNQNIRNNAGSNRLKGPARSHAHNKRSIFRRPRDPWVQKPTYALQVGEPLTGTLRSAQGGSAVWPGVGGSLPFGKVFPAASLTDDGGGEGSGQGAMQARTLLGSDPGTVRTVMARRRTVLRDDDREDHMSGNELGPVGGWLLRAPEATTNVDIGSEKRAMQATTLLGSDPGTMGEAMAMRRTVLREDRSERHMSGKKHGTLGGWLPRVQGAPTNRFNMGGASGKETRTVGGWVPWARGDKRSTFDHIEEAPANPEEICVAVSDKGCGVSQPRVVSKFSRYTAVVAKAGYVWSSLNGLSAVVL